MLAGWKNRLFSPDLVLYRPIFSHIYWCICCCVCIWINRNIESTAPCQNILDITHVTVVVNAFLVWNGIFLFTKSIYSCLLMPWLLTSPGHQQSWYWLCKLPTAAVIIHSFQILRTLGSQWMVLAWKIYWYRPYLLKLNNYSLIFSQLIGPWQMWE